MLEMTHRKIQNCVRFFAGHLLLYRSDDGLAKEPKILTWQTCTNVVQDWVLNIYRVRQESNETGAIFFYLTFTYKSTISPSK